jgi:hypothetical protein
MSLLAGFDVVIELSPAGLLEVLKGKLKLGAVRANPPFELLLPFAVGGVSATMDTIVTGATVAVNADGTLTLTWKFGVGSGTSITLGPPVETTIPLLSGSLAVTAPIVLVPATVPPSGGEQAPSLSLAQSTVKLTFDSTSQSKITSALAGSPITLTSLSSALQTAAGLYVKTVPATAIAKGYKVVPGVPGSLNPLRFASLEAHTIGTKAVGLFGMLFPEKPTGDSTQKTTTALTGAHEVCVSMSPEVFHRLEFCPALVAKFNVPNAAALPPPCGGSSGIDVEGVTMTSIADSFDNGHVNVDGSVEKDGFCYHAEGPFHGEITFTASGTTLTPNLWLAQPDIDVDIPIYCAPVQLVFEIFGYLQQLINGAIIQGIAGGIAESAIDSITEKGLASQQIGGISSAEFDAVTVTPEGLTLNGMLTVFLPFPAQAGFDLTGSVTTSNAEVLSTGTHLAVAGFCPPAEFPYTEYAQTQTASFQVVPHLIGLPLKILWSIIPGDGSAAIPLNEPSVPTEGDLTIPNQTVGYPFPSANGSIVGGVDIHIHTSTSGLGIQLTNVPEEGNYTFTLKATVEDSRGKLFTKQTYVQFVGDAVVIGGGYDQYVTSCEGQFAEWMDKHASAADFVAPWVPVDRPAPEVLAAYIRAVWNVGSRESLNALAEAKLAHGTSYRQALASGASLPADALLRTRTPQAGPNP